MCFSIVRIERDLKNIVYTNYSGGIAYAELRDGNSLIVEACVIGRRLTRYQDDMFVVEIQFSKDYPFAPPTVTFITEIIYPGVVLPGGQLITNFLQENWTPINTIQGILDHILDLLD